jgi:hypothetical protein
VDLALLNICLVTSMAAHHHHIILATARNAAESVHGQEC